MATSSDPALLRKPPARAFHQFTLLPTEIRLKIWFYALPGPRHMAITDYFGPLPRSCSTPSIHSVCRESHEVFLRHYHQRSWELPQPLRSMSVIPGCRTWVSHINVWMARQKDFDFFEWEICLPMPYSNREHFTRRVRVHANNFGA